MRDSYRASSISHRIVFSKSERGLKRGCRGQPKDATRSDVWIYRSMDFDIRIEAERDLFRKSISASAIN